MYRDYMGHIKEEPITSASRRIRISDYIGTWDVVAKTIHNGQIIYLLEHETDYCYDTECIAVDIYGNVVCDGIYDNDFPGCLDY